MSLPPWPLLGLRGPLAKLDAEEEVAVDAGAPVCTSEQAALLHTVVGRWTCAFRLLPTPPANKLCKDSK